jgi:hypothetical protein
MNDSSHRDEIVRLGGASLNDGEARSRENARIATCYDKLALRLHRRDNS